MHFNEISWFQYFKVPVYETASGKILSENEITEQLLLILKENKGESVPIGILTTEHRDTLAIAYENLTKGMHSKQIFV